MIHLLFPCLGFHWPIRTLDEKHDAPRDAASHVFTGYATLEQTVCVSTQEIRAGHSRKGSRPAPILLMRTAIKRRRKP